MATRLVDAIVEFLKELTMFLKAVRKDVENRGL